MEFHSMQLKGRAEMPSARGFASSKSNDGLFKLFQSRNYTISMCFVLQIQLFLGVFVYFGADATNGTNVASFARISFGAFTFASMTFFLLLRNPDFLIHSSFINPSLVPIYLHVATCWITGESLKKEKIISTFTIFATIVSITIGILWRQHDDFILPKEIFRTAIKSLRAHPGISKQSQLVASLLQIWYFIWTIATVGIFCWTQNQRRLVPCIVGDDLDATMSGIGENIKEGHSTICEEDVSVHPALLFLLFASLYWTREVAKNFVQMETASRIGKWWRLESWVPSDIDFPTTFTKIEKLLVNSFQFPLIRHYHEIREMTLSLQANCEKFDHNMLANREQGQEQERTPLWPNAMSFIHMGVFGEDWLQAQKLAKRTIQKQGWEHLSIDQSIEKLFLIVNFSVALATAVYAHLQDNSVFLGLFCGFISASSVMYVFRAACHAVLLGVANFQADGQLLKTSLFFELKYKWNKIYPGTWKEES